MQLYVKNKIRRKGQFQFYQHQLVEALLRLGCSKKKEYMPSNIIYKAVRRFCFCSPSFILGFLKCLPFSSKKIVITSRGTDLLEQAFPYWGYDIVPVLWDVWPVYWDKLYHDLRLLKVKTVFVTVESMAKKLTDELGVTAYWLPEGIDVSDYKPGDLLVNRKIQVYELGRQHPVYHNAILSLINKNVIRAYKGNSYTGGGKLKALAFPTAIDLLQALPNIQICVCFPKCDTHPKEAGGIETLTQRYWEVMLSRCIIVGRAPKELVKIIGYDPVVNVDFTKPELQLTRILNDIESYQEIVDKNYTTALKYASWDLRAKYICKTITQDDNGYKE